MRCIKCGSMAINPHLHGRGSTDLNLCDVCYWRERATNSIKPQLADMREQAAIVRQRLEYHFRTTDGGFMVPDSMPFMKEFLGALDMLLKKVEHVS